jgi:HemY protein
MIEPAPAAAPAPPPPEPAAVTAAPLFRQRADIPKDAARASIPAVIPIVRAPDDPGIDEERLGDEFAEPVDTVQRQAGGWRGFLSRWGG